MINTAREYLRRNRREVAAGEELPEEGREDTYEETDLYRALQQLDEKERTVVICKYFDDDIEKIRYADEEEISSIEGIGPVIAGSLADYFKSAENNRKLDHLLSHLHLVHEETSAEQVFAGKTFVITGSVEHFSNRSEAKEFIEARGGKVTGSVTKKTDYLINNDKTSASSKNKKAQELGIPILSEEDFLELAGI